MRAVFERYRKHHPRAFPHPSSASKEWRAILARLKEGYTVEQLCEAVDGCHVSPFHMGQNARGKVYDSLELIVRDGSKVNGFLEVWQAHRAKATSKTGPDRPGTPPGAISLRDGHVVRVRVMPLSEGWVKTAPGRWDLELRRGGFIHDRAIFAWNGSSGPEEVAYQTFSPNGLCLTLPKGVAPEAHPCWAMTSEEWFEWETQGWSELAKRALRARMLKPKSPPSAGG